jgi:hypothetical protein
MVEARRDIDRLDAETLIERLDRIQTRGVDRRPQPDRGFGL